MPICCKCGKVLCNNQSLEYHMSSNQCLKKKEKEKVKLKCSCICSLHGDILKCEQSFADFMNISIKEAIGSNLYIFVYEKDLFYVSRIHNQILIDRQDKQVNFRRIAKDGKVIITQSNWSLTDNNICIRDTYNQNVDALNVNSFKNYLIVESNLEISYVGMDIFINILKGTNYFALIGEGFSKLFTLINKQKEFNSQHKSSISYEREFKDDSFFYKQVIESEVQYFGNFWIIVENIKSQQLSKTYPLKIEGT